MSNKKKTAMVICPGRGTYNRDELGYLKKYHSDKKEFIAMVDAVREKEGQEPISVLDGREKYNMGDHMRGDNASALIYACAYADFMAIDRNQYDVVAVTGNSMGWYIALACAAAASPEHAMTIINTMGSLMQKHQTGGQILYPFVDEDWQEVEVTRQRLYDLAKQIDGLYISIELGGMIVFAGTDEALEKLKPELPPLQNLYPLLLSGHGAYHSAIMNDISGKAFEVLGQGLFAESVISMIDGRGHIWSPSVSDPQDVYDYTFRHQICKTYDFTKAVQVGVKEFAPDCLIVLGPGTTLGGAVAQSLIDIDWLGLNNKNDFSTLQKNNPFIISMGREDQRDLVT